MATRSFLSSVQWEQAQEVLTPPLMTPDGDFRQVFCFSAENFSGWLSARLEELFKSSPEWEECHPIILGSWARGELCPKSDIDVLFCGAEEKVKLFVDKANEQGLKLRYRMPHNPEDWTENVEAFDILALLKARPWTPEGAQKLFEQQKRIWSKKNYHRRILLKAVKEERKNRARRFDSITNYLEPNIKFGPGGLRDLEQGLQIYELFAEKFTHPGHALNVLHYYRNYFLSLRQKLHLEGHGDILSNAVQFDLGKWMGFKTHKDFMRDLQRGLSRVHFYSDWIVEVAQASAKDLKKLEQLEFKKFEDLSAALHKNPSVLVQKKVRENLDLLLPDNKVKSLAKRRGVELERLLDINASDEFLVSVFRSRLIDKLVPEMRRLVGYVQHDQYHRFTADSHIMQACREVKRIFKKPSQLGPLKFLQSKLNKEDWRILSWSCLYHDLAKGLESGEHHSDLGVIIVEKDFKSYRFSKTFTDEVKWMVKNHLEISQAAFRKNPKDPKVWQELREKGVDGARLYRLALFTAIDIRATNPEAWNEWKAKLLRDLVFSLESKKARDYFEFQTLRLRKKLQLSPEIIEELGPVLLDSLALGDLVNDLKKAEHSTTSLAPLVYKSRKGEVWIRFHEKEDRTGLLSDYVGQLYSLGLGIRHASIHTLAKVGVYDWFQVSTTRHLSQLAKILENTKMQSKAIPSVKFDSIQLISSDDKEWVISFKGPDQAGLLASAAKSLSELGMSIKSARVHTWGRQVDDIFFVKALEGEPQELIANLRQKYQI
ncbi:MAG: protein-PII uridylyltransferase [Bdellovibrio sp. ArHS]|uniref:[protein-PII] uridylyltransferase family protein n=1 Tax=Bdellovibrio sp. ArHS TaxID=1569284 RepID=UPI000582B558|nr:HD domain-containing protein [Bdellovibrio sp. ArHS]KHD88884.1 MAG: protein-PII uridylyltransferase [Bdellovibrio sp. ArHS]